VKNWPKNHRKNARNKRNSERRNLRYISL